MEVWEGLVEAVQRETGADDPPMDAFELAAVCGLKLVPWRREHGGLLGDEIRFPATARPTRQHGVISHEIGHWLLRWSGETDSEPAARYMSGALMLPRRAFDRDLRETWDVGELRERHVNASAEMIAVRICQLRDAVASIFDEGKLRARYSSTRVPVRKASDLEYGLAAEALASGQTVRHGDLCRAVPVFDGSFRRVVVVCEAEAVWRCG